MPASLNSFHMRIGLFVRFQLRKSCISTKSTNDYVPSAIVVLFFGLSIAGGMLL